MEEVNDIIELRNIVKQIIQDVYSENYDSRMSEKEAMKLKTFIRNNGIDINRIYDIKLTILKLIIEEAKILPLYFNRFFPVCCESLRGRDHLLAISHSGIKLVNRHRENYEGEKLNILESHGFDSINDIQITTLNTIKILLKNSKSLILHTQWVYEINDIITAFLKETKLIELSLEANKKRNNHNDTSNYIFKDSSLKFDDSNAKFSKLANKLNFLRKSRRDSIVSDSPKDTLPYQNKHNSISQKLRTNSMKSLINIGLNSKLRNQDRWRLNKSRKEPSPTPPTQNGWTNGNSYRTEDPFQTSSIVHNDKRASPPSIFQNQKVYDEDKRRRHHSDQLHLKHPFTALGQSGMFSKSSIKLFPNDGPYVDNKNNRYKSGWKGEISDKASDLSSTRHSLIKPQNYWSNNHDQYHSNGNEKSNTTYRFETDGSKKPYFETVKSYSNQNNGNNLSHKAEPPIFHKDSVLSKANDLKHHDSNFTRPPQKFSNPPSQNLQTKNYNNHRNGNGHGLNHNGSNSYDNAMADNVTEYDERNIYKNSWRDIPINKDLNHSFFSNYSSNNNFTNGSPKIIEDDINVYDSYCLNSSNPHSFFYYALLNFRICLEKLNLDPSLELLHEKCIQSGEDETLSCLLNLKQKYFRKFDEREHIKLITYIKKPLDRSLLKLKSNEESKLALECFLALLRYMNDYPMSGTEIGEVDCIYTILTSCHRFSDLQDEIFCQIIKQLINNKSDSKESCVKGWKAMIIMTSYFNGSEKFRPYLLNFIQSTSLDRNESCCDIAKECLNNYEMTIKFAGRKNVPSAEEILALSYGKSFKRQFYRIPGGGGRLFQLKCSSVVEKVIKDICWDLLEAKDKKESSEFALYIVYPTKKVEYLNKDEYILDVTTELDKKFVPDTKNGYFIFFKRNMWSYQLNFANMGQCYIEFHYKQILADYLAGLIFMIPNLTIGPRIPQYIEDDLAELACLIHRASGAESHPALDDISFLFPETLLENLYFDKNHWHNIILTIRKEFNRLSPSEARIKFMESLLKSSQLFGSTYFNVKCSYDQEELDEKILAINKTGIYFLPPNAHEILQHHPYRRIESVNKSIMPNGSFIELKVKTSTVFRILKISTDQCHEAFYLLNAYMRKEFENIF
ncbi:unnamed protein product [Gordionus sp. m RMFG-2023]